jgi:uncharacterized membrane protein
MAHRMNTVSSQLRIRSIPARTWALGFVFLWFFIGGIAHFAFTQLEMKIVPPWLPQHRMLVLLSGLFELAGAVGVLISRTRSLAGWGLILLTLAVTPANIYMWQEPGLFPQIPYWALTLRLPLQLALLSCIWWATRALPQREPDSAA